MRVIAETETENGWTRWVGTYKQSRQVFGKRIICCDCGLAHDMEFRHERGGQLLFRARRNGRSTAGVRRGMKAHKRRK